MSVFCVYVSVEPRSSWNAKRESWFQSRLERPMLKNKFLELIYLCFTNSFVQLNIISELEERCHPKTPTFFEIFQRFGSQSRIMVLFSCHSLLVLHRRPLASLCWFKAKNGPQIILAERKWDHWRKIQCSLVKIIRIITRMTTNVQTTLPPMNFLPTESLSAQPNLHFYVPFSFSAPASHCLLLLLLLHVKFKEQDLRQSIGVNPSSLVLLVEEEDECGPIRWPPSPFFLPMSVFVCLFITKRRWFH